MALTILAPFVGYLVLFNQTIVQQLSLATEILGSPAGDGVTAATLQRLYFLYFGLIFLGLGSGLFALFCPIEIKDCSSAREYVEAESPLISRSKIALAADVVAEHLVRWLSSDPYEDDDHYPDKRNLRIILAQPPEFIRLADAVLTELFTAYQTGEDAPKDLPDDDQEWWTPFCDHRGGPSGYKIARAMYLVETPYLGVVRELHDLASEDTFNHSILNLQYLALDNIKPWMRVLTVGFYVAGFALLSIPTLLTMVSIINHMRG